MDELRLKNRDSWLNVSKFYEAASARGSGQAAARALLPLVHRLMASEICDRFRAGQSLTTLIISTAEKHGLGPGDPYVSVYFGTDDSFQLSYKAAGEGSRPAVTTCWRDDVEAVLRRLLVELERQ